MLQPDEIGAPSQGERRPWRVLKFGGTSVASASRWAAIESIVRRRTEVGAQVMLVCSAVSGVTNLLTRIIERRRTGAAITADLAEVRERHLSLARALDLPTEVVAHDLSALDQLVASAEITAQREADILAKGEMLSTRLGAAYLAARGVSCAWIDARELLEAEADATHRDESILSASCACDPDPSVVARAEQTGAQVLVTQGFIARSPAGNTVLLGRGGSDTSAAYLACLLTAERLEIWTDVPGLFTANPRTIPDARLIKRIGYREAQALGALGAKVLHPRALEAVWEHGIPVETAWTERPEVGGTCINAARAGAGARAVTARRNLAMFVLNRPPSWQPVGFLADVSACFAKRGLSMDLVSSSCSEIRVTLDLDAFPSATDELPELVDELSKTCHARVVQPVASVSIVGRRVSNALLGHDDGLGLFADEALFMVVHAANEHHVSFVLEGQAAERLVRTSHDALIADCDRHDLGGSWHELVGAGDSAVEAS